HAHVFLGDGGQIIIDVHRKKFAEMLRDTFNFKFASRSNLNHVPKLILSSSKNVQRAFLRGLFSADGTVYDGNGSPSVALYSTSKKLLEQVQLMLLTFGIPSTLTLGNRSKNTTIKGKKYRVKHTWRLIINGEKAKEFFEKIGFTGTKRERLGKLFSSKRMYKTKHRYMYVKVEEVEKCGKEVVYDVMAPDTYTWTTNGLYSKDCGEEPLYPYESCNLGSINLYAHVKFDSDGKTTFDWEEFKKTISIATRFLDNIIDINKFPFEKIEKTTKASRKIGLGFMGFADVLFALKIPYNSEKGFKFMRKITEFLTYYAMLASVELAKSRGTFPLFKESGYVKGEMPIEGYYHKSWWTLDWNKLVKEIKKHGIRNAEVTTIAPTGSISMIVDVSSGLEPQFALIYEKRVPIGTFYYIDAEFERQLKERGLYNDEILKLISDNGGSVQGLKKIPKDMRDVFVVAYDIPWWDHVRAQAEATKWICAAVSKTINMPNWATPEDVLNAFLFAHKLGIKGITVYREGSKRVQVLVTPSQKRGKYATTPNNRTLDMMKSLGIKITKKKKFSLSTLKEEELKELKKRSSTVPTSGGIEVCPNCGSEKLVYREGCVRCLDCDWTECILA
ncbi:MAG TPA: adenosylcobalamin-dependent ribonucleoside-diphosphate reductase, partial [Candidatus Aenigmarchaeota archaeon]|nr:adenosylcobalamin-dependent ribonucleoside-diphosphate reductase [Candidatus Aenigmarchaeota archaeon]